MCNMVTKTHHGPTVTKLHPDKDDKDCALIFTMLLVNEFKQFVSFSPLWLRNIRGISVCVTFLVTFFS